MGNIVTVEFRGNQLFGFKQDDGVFVALKPIVEGMGIQWNAQRERIYRDPVLSEGTRIIRVPFGRGGPQETVCLRLDLLNGWFFSIESNRIKDESIRLRVQDYQRECYAVLAQHFLGEGRNDTGQAQPQAIPSLREKTSMIETARRIGGSEAARELWDFFDFPPVQSFSKGSPTKGPQAAGEQQVKAFVEQGCFFNVAVTTPARALYQAYLLWSDSKDLLSETAFGRNMQRISKHYDFSKKQGRTVSYIGLAARGADHAPRRH